MLPPRARRGARRRIAGSARRRMRRCQGRTHGAAAARRRRTFWMTRQYLRAAFLLCSSLLAPVQTILPEEKMSAVVFGSRMRMMTAAKRFGLYSALRADMAIFFRSSCVFMLTVETTFLQRKRRRQRCAVSSRTGFRAKSAPKRRAARAHSEPPLRVPHCRAQRLAIAGSAARRRGPPAHRARIPGGRTGARAPFGPRSRPQNQQQKPWQVYLCCNRLTTRRHDFFALTLPHFRQVSRADSPSPSLPPARLASRPSRFALRIYSTLPAPENLRLPSRPSGICMLQRQQEATATMKKAKPMDVRPTRIVGVM